MDCIEKRLTHVALCNTREAPPISWDWIMVTFQNFDAAKVVRATATWCRVSNQRTCGILQAGHAYPSRQENVYI